MESVSNSSELLEHEKLKSHLVTASGHLLLRAGTLINEQLREHFTTENLDGLALMTPDEFTEEKSQRSPKDEEGVNDPVLRKWLLDLAGIDMQIWVDPLIDSECTTAAFFAKHLPVQHSASPWLKDMRPVEAGGRTWDDKQEIRRAYKDSVSVLEDLYRGLHLGELNDVRPMYQVVDTLMGALMKDRNLMLNMSANCTIKKEYIFRHAVDTAILAMDIASRNFSASDVRKIGLGALFADAGMIYVPEKVRTKNDVLSADEMKIMRLHPWLSFSLLERIPGMPLEALVIAIQAHERHNGSGYPRQLKSSEIHELASIVSIADVFQAIIRNKSYKPGQKPYSGVETVLKMGQTGFFDRNVLKTFLAGMGLFPVGSFVSLSSGAIGRVVETPLNGNISQPKVAVLTDENGNPLSEEMYYHRDLGSHRGLKVVGTLLPSNETFKVTDLTGF